MMTTVALLPQREQQQDQQTFALQRLLPSDIWNSIFEYDTTFRNIFSLVISSEEMIDASWMNWSRQFISQPFFDKYETDFGGRVNALMVYARTIGYNSDRPFQYPTNIIFRCGYKNLLYKDGKFGSAWTNFVELEQVLIGHGAMELSLEFNNGEYYQNYRVVICTRAEYYYRVHVNYEDTYEQEQSAWPIGDYYVLEYFSDYSLPNDYSLVI